MKRIDRRESFGDERARRLRRLGEGPFRLEEYGRDRGDRARFAFFWIALTAFALTLGWWLAWAWANDPAPPVIDLEARPAPWNQWTPEVLDELPPEREFLEASLDAFWYCENVPPENEDGPARSPSRLGGRIPQGRGTAAARFDVGEE